MGKFILFLLSTVVAALSPCHAEVIAEAGGTNNIARVRLSSQPLEMQPGHFLRLRVAWTNAPSPGFAVAHFINEPATSEEPAMTMLLGPDGFLKLQPATNALTVANLASMNKPSAGGAYSANIRVFAKPNGGVRFLEGYTDSWPEHVLEIPAFTMVEIIMSGSFALVQLDATVHRAPTLFMVR